jgi:hypothetical protein
MIKNDKKIPARRGFFLAITMLISLLTCTKAAATSMPRSYWERLLHVEHGQSRVQSNEFFITEHGSEFNTQCVEHAPSMVVAHGRRDQPR